MDSFLYEPITIVHFVNKILIRLLIENLRKKTLNAIGSYLSIENVKIINNISKSLDLSCVYELRMISIQCHLAVKKIRQQNKNMSEAPEHSIK